MPEVRFDAYPAVRLEHPENGAPGVFRNALDGTIISEGVVLWTGAVVSTGSGIQVLGELASVIHDPVIGEQLPPELVQAYFYRLVDRQEQGKRWNFKPDPDNSARGLLPEGALLQSNDSVHPIRNSVCDANGEVYGRILQSLPVITLVNPGKRSNADLEAERNR